jgi:hypothetical protein
MLSYGCKQHQQPHRSGAALSVPAVLSIHSSTLAHCSTHRLSTQKPGGSYAAPLLAAACVSSSNGRSSVSFPWLLQRGARRQLLQPPAATEDSSSAGRTSINSDSSGRGRGRGLSTSSRGSRGRGAGSWAGIDGSSRGSDSDSGGDSGSGSQQSWQAQA